MKRVLIAGWIVSLGFLPRAVWAAESFAGQSLQQRDFSDRNLASADFTDSKLVFAKFRNATLTAAKFGEADLSNADFTGANCQQADFRGAVVAPIYFQKANLNAARLDGLAFQRVSFQNATLKGASLRKAKGIADVQNSDFRGADLRGAVFVCDVYYMTGCRLQGAKYDADTRWPQGFDVSASGAILTPADEPDASPAVSPGPPRKPAAAGKRKPPPADAPTLTEDYVKHVLETEMWGSKDGQGFTYDYKALQLARPRPADISDGTLGFKSGLTVVPVRVQCVVTRDLGNNESRSEEKHQEYLFFKDDFGLWSYRFSKNR